MNKQIALIGFNTLYSIAIKNILHEIGRYSCVCIAELSEQHVEQCDCFIITQDIFISHLDFFLPRKTKIVLVLQNDIKTENISVSKFYVNDDIETIESAISAVLAISKETSNEQQDLSAREIEVLKEIAKGKMNKEIADTLNISVNTVITHRKNISSKLGIRSASGLSLYAMMNGII